MKYTLILFVSLLISFGAHSKSTCTVFFEAVVKGHIYEPDIGEKTIKLASRYDSFEACILATRGEINSIRDKLKKLSKEQFSYKDDVTGIVANISYNEVSQNCGKTEEFNKTKVITVMDSDRYSGKSTVKQVLSGLRVYNHSIKKY